MFVRVAAVVAACGMAVPAFADVTVKQNTSGKGAMGAMSGESVQYIKGTKMRADQTMGGNQMSTIFDVGAQKMIVLNLKKKEADVYDMAQLTGQVAKATGDVQASVTPTSQTRQIAGVACTVHDVKITVGMMMGNDRMEMVMTGPACLAKGAPGAADYKTFYEAAAAKGFFFSDPRAAKAQPGQAKGMSEMYREMADRGVPLSTEMSMKFEGSGMMAGMMNRMGGMAMTSEVTSIATGALDDALFEVPAGFKVKTH